MHRTPILVGKRQNGGTLDAGQNGKHRLQFLAWHIHQHILLILCHFHRFNPEQQLIEHRLFLYAQRRRAANQHRLAIQHHFHLAQIVAHQGATARHNIENAICQPNPRSNLHRTANHMNVGFNALIFQKICKNGRITRGNLLALKPFHTAILRFLWNGKRQAAFAKAQRTNHLHILTLFHHLVQPHNANIGSARSHRIGDIIIAQKQQFHRKIPRRNQ